MINNKNIVKSLLYTPETSIIDLIAIIRHDIIIGSSTSTLLDIHKHSKYERPII